MAAGLVAWLRTSRDAITWIVTVLFAAKLAWEHFAGPLPLPPKGPFAKRAEDNPEG